MQVTLPASAEASRQARRALDGWLSDVLGEPEATDVRLAASELVENAVRHGRLTDEDGIVLRAAQTEQGVRIEVEQTSSAAGTGLISPHHHTGDPGGFGLRIVEDVASGWGVDEGPPGRVWFEVTRTSDTPTEQTPSPDSATDGS
jgi:anti-sigma regulatory factor (Ser/Thr protein kinase)